VVLLLLLLLLLLSGVGGGEVWSVGEKGRGGSGGMNE